MSIVKLTAEFGPKIKGLRERRGWNQGVVATKLGVSLNAVSQWERSRSYPRGPLLAGLAEVFGLTVEQLLGIDSAPSDTRDQALDRTDSLPYVADLLGFMHADLELDPFTHLPGGQGARERYRERLAETERELEAYAQKLKRGLAEYKAMLIAEARDPKGKRPH
jgi:transcriptional regulator with XRE-family HTH domain